VEAGRVDPESPGRLAIMGDVPYNGPGAAATVALGGNQSGPLAWRTEDGTGTYKDWQEAKLKQVGVKASGG
jgi:hypothetical protein